MSGGSTNHTIHLVAIAAAAGININWDDFSELSDVVPLMARVYPNGQADVNHFHAADGLGFCIRSLLDTGLLHNDVKTIMGDGLEHFCKEPQLIAGKVEFKAAQSDSLDTEILQPASSSFSARGGLQLVQGNLGRAIIKTSAVDESTIRLKHRLAYLTASKALSMPSMRANSVKM